MALRLGKTVREMLAAMDSRELSEWIAFDQVEPLPDSYWQAGQICAVTARALGARGRIGPEDFMPVPRRRDVAAAATTSGAFELAKFTAFAGALAARAPAPPPGG